MKRTLLRTTLAAVLLASTALPVVAQSIPTVRVGWTIPAEEAKYWLMRRPQEFPNLGKTYKIEFIQFQGTTPMVQAMAAGALDCSTQAPLSLAQGAVESDLNAYIVAQHAGEKPGSFSVYRAVKAESPIKTVAEIKGKKIGAAGANLPWVTAAGATGVSTNLADAYNSLNTGIYEGVIVWAESLKSFKLCEQGPYIFDGGMGAVQGHSVTFNKQVWAKLPAPVKQVLTEAAPKHSDAATGFVNGGAGEALEWCKATYKTEIFKPNAEEKKAWVMAIPNAAKEWAADLEKANMPGKAILTKYMDALRAANQPIVRHWYKE